MVDLVKQWKEAARRDDLFDHMVPSDVRLLVKEIERLKAINEHDRTQVAEVFTAIKEAIRRREWLRLGRGSYEYEDDRWRGEFSEAIDEIIEAAKPLQRIAADWSDCPTDPKEIAAARANRSDCQADRNDSQ